LLKVRTNDFKATGFSFSSLSSSAVNFESSGIEDKGGKVVEFGDAGRATYKIGKNVSLFKCV